jgi:hypothetical protein
MINIIINDIMHYLCRGRRGHDRMQLPMHSVPITTDVVSSGRGVHHYVIKFVSDLRQVGGFLRVLRFPPTTKT